MRLIPPLISATFVNFVRYLIASADDPKGESDTHWTPISSHCRPCRVEYDAVLKVETMADDFAAMRRRLPDLLADTELKRLHQGGNIGLFLIMVTSTSGVKNMVSMGIRGVLIQFFYWIRIQIRNCQKSENVTPYPNPGPES